MARGKPGRKHFIAGSAGFYLAEALAKAGRQPEIKKLRTGLREDDVTRFDIPVHDTLTVRHAQTVGELMCIP